MIGYVNDLLAAQTLSGRVICLIIMGVLALYIVMSLCVLFYYSAISRKAIRLRAGKELGVGADMAFYRKTAAGFEDAIRKGVKDISETAIMDNAINPFIRYCEYAIHYLPSLATILGLMGTFFGLTSAIGKMDLRMDSMLSVEDIINNINAPISDMSTAFYTSLVGIIASVGMNILERAARINVKGIEAFSNARDYMNIEYQNAVMGAMNPAEKYQILENHPASIAWTEASRRIGKALQALKESTDKMSEDISSLETRGLMSLSGSITTLIRTYQLEHDDVASVNESLRGYLNTLSGLGKALEQNSKVMGANETLLEQMSMTYRMLAEEHKMYEQALEGQADSELLKLIRDQLNLLISRIETAAKQYA